MEKPNYMLIGASKCGTSSICNHLGNHPDVFMVECKEPQFFARDEVYARGMAWYESLYAPVDGEKMIGEGSNTYTMKEVFPQAASRLVAYAPEDLKLIYCVRNPISRIESFWLELRAHGGEVAHYDFNQAVKVNRNRLVDASNYWQQISVYRNFFLDSNIHIIFFEDFVRDSEGTMRKCFEFLGVDPEAAPINSNLHAGKTSGRLAPRDTLSKFRSYKIFRSLTKLVPDSLRRTLKRKLLFKKIDGRPQWQAQTREWVASILEKDTERFLEFYGKPKDFWQLRAK